MHITTVKSNDASLNLDLSSNTTIKMLEDVVGKFVESNWNFDYNF